MIVRRAVGGRREVAAGVLVVAVVSLPLLKPFGLPPGPGNTGLPDLTLVLLAFVTVLWASGRGEPVRFPYALPTALTVAAGAIAALQVGDAGVDPVLTLMQDVFVFCWAMCLATLGRDPALLRTAFVAFAASGVAYAALMTAGVIADIEALSGQTEGGGLRANFTFGDANYPANYFLVSLFVLRAAQWPRHSGRRAFCCALLVTAIVLTLSNGGMLALGVAAAAGLCFRLLREGRAWQAVALSCAGALTLTWLATVNLGALAAKGAERSPLLRDSIGRVEEESASTRGTILSEISELMLSGQYPLGIGPASTEATLARHQYPYVNEAHNDYIAAVFERGPVGGLAVLVLGVLLAAYCSRIARRGALTSTYAAIVPRPELLGALVIAMGVSGLFYEVLHYRHGWALFGLIAALYLHGRAPAAPGTAALSGTITNPLAPRASPEAALTGPGESAGQGVPP